MKIPLQITFRNMLPFQAIEDNIREKASKLESFYDRIMGCRVIVAAPHRHHRKGKAYEVRIDLTVPGGELVINRSPKRLKTAGLALTDGPETQLIESHEPGKHGAHADVYVAVRDAFNAAGRKLQDYARRQSGAVKLHESRTRARGAKLFPKEKYRFLQHLMSVRSTAPAFVQPGFDHLDVGAKVKL
jgi:ribosome-associated translation inhibitor RaiA